MKPNIKKFIAILLALGATFAIGGYVAALNGWFGGGAAIPEDTMTRGLVGYWSMDEGAGQTAYDGSDSKNNGTLGSSASADTADPKWTKGKNGGALKFDGVNDYVDAGNAASLNITTFAVTFSAWIKTSETTQHDILVKAGGGVWWMFRVTEPGVLYAQIYDGTNQVRVKSSQLINDNNWHHVAATLQSGVAGYAYVDGIQSQNDEAHETVTTISPSGTMKIAKGDLTDNYFSGSIDEVRIYNRALSAEEVRYHYNRGGPVAEWKFDEGSGTKVYDSTENNKNGTLHE